MAEPITAVLLRAAELTASGKPRKAIDLLRPALVANPLHAEGWCRLAAAHLDAGEPDPALDAAKRALIVDADQAWAQRLAALALSELGRHREAAVAARESVRRKPADWRCHVVLAEVLAADPATRAEAVEVAEHAVELAPEETRTYQVLGDAALRNRAWGLAERAYRAALRLDPSDTGMRANLATVQSRRGGPAGPQRRGSSPSTGQALNAAQALVWPAFSRVSVLLVAGGLLLLLAGMPQPTPLLAWLSGALVIACLAVLLHLVLTAGKGVRRALYRLPKYRGRVAVTAVALGLALVLLTGWTIALSLGAKTMQPLVLGWLCSVAGGAVVFLSGQGMKKR